MNPLDALYFPDTVPDPGELARLLLFFDTIYHYLPNEATDAEQLDAKVTGPATPCRSYPPVPFGKDLEEFRRLVKKLMNRPYIPGQLSSLSLATLSLSTSHFHHLLHKLCNKGSGVMNYNYTFSISPYFI